MAVDLIGSVATAAPVLNSATALGQDDFLKILMTQLTYQDPLKPLDNQQFIAQMAQFSALEQSRQLNDKIDSLLSAQAVTQAFGLLGKTVEYTAVAGGPVNTGTVNSVSINPQSGQPMLGGSGAGGQVFSQLSLSSVTSVR